MAALHAKQAHLAVQERHRRQVGIACGLEQRPNAEVAVAREEHKCVQAVEVAAPLLRLVRRRHRLRFAASPSHSTARAPMQPAQEQHEHNSLHMQAEEPTHEPTHCSVVARNQAALTKQLSSSALSWHSRQSSQRAYTADIIAAPHLGKGVPVAKLKAVANLHHALKVIGNYELAQHCKRVHCTPLQQSSALLLAECKQSLVLAV